MEEVKISYLNRKLITFTCDNCGSESEKPESEYKRNIAKGRKNFCCRSCAAIYNNQHRDNTATEKQIKHLQEISNNRKDEFTPFRYLLSCAKKRNKDFNLDLQYLKDLWEQQNGRCPYTNLELILLTSTNIKEIPFTLRASLDRIDSNIGYIKGNVQFVSTPINLMKSEMSDLETKKFLKEISTFTSTFVED